MPVFADAAIYAAENFDLSDAVLGAGIARMVAKTAAQLASLPNQNATFVAAMAGLPVAMNTDDANAQHYELAPAFFEHVLGRHLKYSSCFYPQRNETLDAAEEIALAATCAMADLADGQAILELGCGWGSLSLFMAAQYPNTKITAVSNSQGQRAFIEAQADARGLQNLVVITADMNSFAPAAMFDRVVSVEMFEHMANWRDLLNRVRNWLHPDGRLFIHVFSHTTTPYRFNPDRTDWIGQYFFTGGLMPSHRMIDQFADLFTLEAENIWPGTHYQRTALQWLENFDRNQAVIMPLLRATYGAQARVWRRRWRLFFLAVAGLFGHANGRVWQVSQYRLIPQASPLQTPKN